MPFSSDKFNIAFESLDIILKEDTFQRVCLGSIKTFNFSWCRLLVICIINFILFFSSSFFSIIDLATIIKIIDRTNSTIIALLAIVITGYALFQAMISREALTILACNKDNSTNQNSLNKMQHSTFIIIISYIFLITFNYLFLTFLDVFKIKIIDDILIYALMSIYGTIGTYFIVEIKSFIYNLYQIFTISSSAQIIELFKHLDKDK